MTFFLFGFFADLGFSRAYGCYFGIVFGFAYYIFLGGGLFFSSEELEDSDEEDTPSSTVPKSGSLSSLAWTREIGFAAGCITDFLG